MEKLLWNTKYGNLKSKGKQIKIAKQSILIQYLIRSMDSTRFSVVIVRNPSVNGCITVAFSSGEQQLHSFKCFVPISNLESRLPIQFEYCHVITSEVMSDYPRMDCQSFNLLSYLFSPRSFVQLLQDFIINSTEGLTLEMSVFKTLCGDKFTSTRLIEPNCLKSILL